VRIELMTPGKTIVDPDTYNQLFTLHGAVMIFLFIIPGIPAALGNFVLPLMLGAKDVALPRLNLTSFWFWMIGAVFAVVSIIIGAVDTGWTFYTPYSTTTGTAVISMTLGVFILGAYAAGGVVDALVRAPAPGGARFDKGLLRLVAASFIVPLASLINPYGLKLALFPFIHQAADKADALKHIGEWVRIPFKDLFFYFYPDPVTFFSFRVRFWSFFLFFSSLIACMALTLSAKGWIPSRVIQ